MNRLPTTLARGRRRPARTRRIVVALAVTTVALPAAAGVAGAAGAFKAHVLYSGGRTTDLRVGEPLGYSYGGKKIGQICWNPAPIQHTQCSKAFAAPAKAGEQKLQLKFDDGRVVYETLQIGARATAVAPSLKAFDRGTFHAIEYKASCAVKGYSNYESGKLHSANTVYDLKKGDAIAAYYRAGSHVIQGFGYTSTEAAFWPDACLKPVR